MTSWIKEAVFYHIYPLGFVGAAQYHEEEITHSIKKVEDWIPHIHFVKKEVPQQSINLF